MQRRTLLKLTGGAVAVLVLAGGAASLVAPGLQNGSLSSTGREVFRAVGFAVLDKTLPAQEGAREIALSGLLTRINALIAALPLPTQAELSQLLALIGSALGRRTVVGLGVDWSSASTFEVQQALESMRASSLSLRQQAYAALHEITAGAYFSDPSTWSVLGYPGPLKI